MNSEAEFLAALEANPGDELVYDAIADWLEERGDERAAWVRSPRVRVWMGERLAADPVAAILAALKAKRRFLDARRAMPDLGAAPVAGLVGLLGDDSSIVRLQAVWCLRRIGPPAAAAVPALLEAMKDVSPDVREQAANAIEDITKKKAGPASAVEEDKEQAGDVLPQLLRWLASKDVNERLMAVGGFAKLRRADCVVPLCRALADEAECVREAAARQLIWVAKRNPDESVWALRHALADASAKVRSSAATALGIVGKPAAVVLPDLVRLLDDEDAWVRQCAVGALGGVAAGDRAVLEHLHRATTDRNCSVAVWAAYTMSRWRSLPPESGGVLLAMIARLGHRYAGNALAALGKVEHPTPAVLAALRRSVAEGSWEASEALGRQGVAGAVPDLIRAARSGNYHAAVALGRSREITPLVAMLDDPSPTIRAQGVYGLRFAGEAAVVALPRLLEMVRDTAEDSLRLSAIPALRAIGPAAAEAAPDLIPFLSDGTQWGCGAEAFKALDAFGAALLPHVPALADLCDPDTPARLRAVRLLAMLAKHSPAVLAPLRRALRAVARAGKDAAKVRRYAAEAFGHLGPATLPDLAPLLTDPDEIVRRFAARARDRIQRQAGGT